MSDVPFEVTDEVVLGDMSGVSGPSSAVPPAQGVLFDIKEASNKVYETEDGVPKLKQLNLQLRISEGIEINGEYKYQGKVLFGTAWIWYNPEFYTKGYWTNGDYRFEVKQILLALGYDIVNPPKINDDFLREIQGRQLRANIKVVKRQVKDSSTGTYVDSDEDDNEVYGYKAA